MNSVGSMTLRVDEGGTAETRLRLRDFIGTSHCAVLRVGSFSDELKSNVASKSVLDKT